MKKILLVLLFAFVFSASGWLLFGLTPWPGRPPEFSRRLDYRGGRIEISYVGDGRGGWRYIRVGTESVTLVREQGYRISVECRASSSWWNNVTLEYGSRKSLLQYIDAVYPFVRVTLELADPSRCKQFNQ